MDAPSPRTAFPHGLRNQASSATVLVVDPEDARRSTLAATLRQSFGRVIEATSSETGLSACTHRRVDLVVVRPELPGLGADVLLDLIRHRGGPPMIAIIAHERTAERARWLDSGGTDCIDARDDVATVVARCAAHLRRRPRYG